MSRSPSRRRRPSWPLRLEPRMSPRSSAGSTTSAVTLGVQGHQRLRKGPLIDAIVAKASSDGHAEAVVEDGAEGPTSKSQKEEAGEGDLLAEGDGRPSAEGESASPAQASAASDNG